LDAARLDREAAVRAPEEQRGGTDRAEAAPPAARGDIFGQMPRLPVQLRFMGFETGRVMARGLAALRAMAGGDAAHRPRQGEAVGAAKAGPVQGGGCGGQMRRRAAGRIVVVSRILVEDAFTGLQPGRAV